MSETGRRGCPPHPDQAHARPSWRVANAVRHGGTEPGGCSAAGGQRRRGEVPRREHHRQKSSGCRGGGRCGTGPGCWRIARWRRAGGGGRDARRDRSAPSASCRAACAHIAAAEAWYRDVLGSRAPLHLRQSRLFRLRRRPADAAAPARARRPTSISLFPSARHPCRPCRIRRAVLPSRRRRI